MSAGTRQAHAVDRSTGSIDARDFRALAYRKGWTLQDLASHWGYSLPWLVKLIDRSDRPVVLNDALRGLRRRGRPLPLPPRWRHGESDRDARADAHAAPGMRYAGYMVVGAVVAAQVDVGSMAEEGMRGIVVQVLREGTGLAARECYRVVFETGEIEAFTPELVDQYLVTTGLERVDLAEYRYVDDAQVRRDHEQGVFDYWDRCNDVSCDSGAVGAGAAVDLQPAPRR